MNDFNALMARFGARLQGASPMDRFNPQPTPEPQLSARFPAAWQQMLGQGNNALMSRFAPRQPQIAPINRSRIPPAMQSAIQSVGQLGGIGRIRFGEPDSY